MNPFSRRCRPLAAFLCLSGCATGAAAAADTRFTDVTAGCGIVAMREAHGVAVEDFDGDGDFDIVIVGFQAPHVQLWRNDGGLKFADATAGSGLEVATGAGTGAAVGDIDNDGDLDLYLSMLRAGGCRLFRNEGKLKFIDVTAASGTAHDAGRSCAMSDVDRDGRLDLYVCCPDGPNRLFRNNGDGTFTDVAPKAGVALPDRHSLGCAFADVDGDGRDDLYVTNYESQPDALFLNKGDGTFGDAAQAAGLTLKSSSVACTFADPDNDGDPDLLVTTDSWLSGANYTEPQLKEQGHTVEPNQLYRNDGGGKFVRIDADALDHRSLGHDATFSDFDHDGDADLYVGVDADSANQWATSKGGNPMWRNDGPGRWTRVEREWGVGHEANTVCVPAADFDGDGDLDLLLVNFYSNVVLLRNNTDDTNWLRVRAAGPGGVGAKVAVTAGDARVGVAAIRSGHGYATCPPLEAHFGLGAMPQAAYRVTVTFPSGKVVVRDGVKPGSRIDVKEGAQ